MTFIVTRWPERQDSSWIAETGKDGVARVPSESAPPARTSSRPSTRRRSVARAALGNRLSVTWTAPPPPPVVVEAPPKDTDQDGIPDASDNCPDVANAESGRRRRRQGRRRLRHPAARRRAGDRRDQRPGQRGQRRGVRQAAEGHRSRARGSPRRRRSAASCRSRASRRCRSAPRSTRARASSTSARRQSSARPGSARSLQQGRFGAGIFKIRQAAKRRAGADQQALHRPRAPDPARASPARAPLQARCGRSRASCARSPRPPRARSARSAARATVTASDGTWIVSDRCDGTLTEVGRGKVDRPRHEARPQRHAALAARATWPRRSCSRRAPRRTGLKGPAPSGVTRRRERRRLFADGGAGLEVEAVQARGVER